jgi:hypothetical protein
MLPAGYIRRLLWILRYAQYMRNTEVRKNGADKLGIAVTVNPTESIPPRSPGTAYLFNSILISFILYMVIDKVPDICAGVFEIFTAQDFGYSFCLP